MTPEVRTLEVAAEVAELLGRHGAKVAVIGAVALAVRGYPRATEDLDLATVTDPFTTLRAAERELAARGYDVALAMPDADDPLGGVLDVRAPGADLVQVVNYQNPWKGCAPVGKSALDHAEPDALPPLAVVDVAHLVALKLYAGGSKSRLDVLELLARQPAEAIEAARATCAWFGLGKDLEALLGPTPPALDDG